MNRKESINKINIAIISNISFEPYFESLVSEYFCTYNNMNPELFSIPYEEYNSPEYKESLLNSDITVVWIDCELLLQDPLVLEEKAIDDIVILSLKLFNDISQITKTNIIWFLFEDYYNLSIVVKGHTFLNNGLVDKINSLIYNALNKKVSFVNLKHLIAEVGISAAYDIKNKYRWNAPYSKKMIENVAKEIHKQYMIEKGITKKCLILDCDNVLWGGILSEDGIENIKLGNSGLGRVYQDFQRFILTLYYHGVILAICSKNDSPDVMTMFREHSEMVLKEEHIACFQINWENKPENIRKIANMLNIDFNSIVFVDDSKIEIEAVKSMIPEVLSIIYERGSIYEKLSCFNLKNTISLENVEKRNDTYRTNQAREILKSEYDNYNDYISALDIRIDIHPILPIEYNRVSELTQRTNKCTNSSRYTVAEIKERINDKDITIYSLSVTDRFSDLGIVGAIEIHKNTLSLFCLSCRALGRKIEGKMLSLIKNRHKINEIKFRQTGKNDELKALLLDTFLDAVLINTD